MRLFTQSWRLASALFLSFFFIYQVSGQCYTANAGSDVSICGSGGATIGTASQSGYSYSWSPTTGLSNPNIAQPTANPTNTTTYTLTMTPTTNLLTNPGFENGDLSGWSTDYDWLNSGNPPEGMWIVTSGSHVQSSPSCSLYPRTGSYFFSGHSPDLSVYPIPSQRALYVTLNVSTSTDYNFSGFIATNMNSTSMNFEMTLIGNNTGATSDYFSTASTCAQWTPFSMNWSSSSNTQVTIEIRTESDYPSIWGIDDLKFSTCSESTDQMTFFRASGTPSITPVGPITYYNHYEHVAEVVLTASSSGAYQWYKNNVLIPGATNQTYTIQQSGISTHTDYYKCVNACGTSNVVTFNYTGVNSSGYGAYPVAISSSECMSTLQNIVGIALNAPSLGFLTQYNRWLLNASSCLSINNATSSTGRLKASVFNCNNSESNGVYTTSSKNGEYIYMFYYFYADDGCRPGSGTVNAVDSSEKSNEPPRTILSPNPATSQVTIDSRNKMQRVEIYSMLGVPVRIVPLGNVQTVRLYIGSLPAGLYSVRVIQDKGTETLKLLVQ